MPKQFPKINMQQKEKGKKCGKTQETQGGAKHRGKVATRHGCRSKQDNLI